MLNGDKIFKSRAMTIADSRLESWMLDHLPAKKSPMFKILIDTCVWLELAKDYQQQPILSALEELIRHREIELILPRTVVDEFARNKARIGASDSSRP